MKSCGKFLPNFYYKFSGHLFFQLPSILSKFGLSFLNKNWRKCHLAQFCFNFDFSKTSTPLNRKWYSFIIWHFLLEKNWASYGVSTVFCSENLDQMLSNWKSNVWRIYNKSLIFLSLLIQVFFGPNGAVQTVSSKAP